MEIMILWLLTWRCWWSFHLQLCGWQKLGAKLLTAILESCKIEKKSTSFGAAIGPWWPLWPLWWWWWWWNSRETTRKKCNSDSAREIIEENSAVSRLGGAKWNACNSRVFFLALWERSLQLHFEPREVDLASKWMEEGANFGEKQETVALPNPNTLLMALFCFFCTWNSAANLSLKLPDWRNFTRASLCCERTKIRHSNEMKLRLNFVFAATAIIIIVTIRMK